MRILLVNHGIAGQFKGGDGVQLQQTGRLLQRRGHTVAHTNSNTPDVRGFDLVHVFNCRHLSSFTSQVDTCVATGVPLVVSPIWISIPRAFWGSRASLAALEKVVNHGQHHGEAALASLSQRTFALHQDGQVFHHHGGTSQDHFGLSQLSNILKKAAGLLPNSWLELQAIRTDLHWSGSTFHVAPYGVDPKIFLDSDPEPFRQHTGIRQPFVMQAGRIEPAKNQAMLCWALRDTSLPIVLIGSRENWPGYAEVCKSIAGDRLTIIDHLPPHLLASAYAACGVHALPSWCETCGLVSLEAALSGTPIVGSTFGHELEYLRGDALYADPANGESIKLAVLQSWEEGRENKRANRLKARVLAEFNWENTATCTEDLYARVIETA
jgi:glycosyltransferase involved in cell wall biosynthesis